MNISTIIPTAVDIDRAEGIRFQFQRSHRFYGNGAPYSGEARKMAKLIKDPRKAVRRAKAVANRWGTEDYTGLSNAGRTETVENAWKPFEQRLIELGFTKEQISEISLWREPKESL